MCGRGDLAAKRLMRVAKHALKSIQLNLEIQVWMCRANPKPPLISRHANVVRGDGEEMCNGVRRTLSHIITRGLDSWG